MHSFVRIYCALTEEISFAEMQMEDLMKTRSFLVKSMHANAPSKIRTSHIDPTGRKSNFVPYSLDRIAGKLHETDIALEHWKEYLQIKRETKQKLDVILQKLDGLEWKLIFMRDKLGLTLTKIAEMLGYSYEHVKRVSSRLNKANSRRIG
ncbi:hypothetical protein ABD77_07030 [Brevibacillus formosus]|nr:hypothetical protein [Brevibacillus formosus]